MLLPAAVRPYAADVDGTDSRVRCAIALNGSQDLRIQLCGRLKRGLFGLVRVCGIFEPTENYYDDGAGR